MAPDPGSPYWHDSADGKPPRQLHGDADNYNGEFIGSTHRGVSHHDRVPVRKKGKRIYTRKDRVEVLYD